MFNSSKEIAELKEKLQAAEASVADLQGKLTAKEGEFSAANTKAKDLEGKLAEASTKITTLEAEKLAAENALKVRNEEFDAKLNAAVIEKCAAAGITPIANDPNAGAGGETKTRAEFDKLDHSARNAFFAAGGKLIN